MQRKFIAFYLEETIFNHKETVATASLVNNLFKLDVPHNFGISTQAKANDSTLWHRRMAHLKWESLNILRNGLDHGIQVFSCKPPDECEVYLSKVIGYLSN